MPIDSKPSDKDTFFSVPQPLKQSVAIDFIPEGIEIVPILTQLLNAPEPIVSRLSGRFINFRFEQLSKALSPIVFIPSGSIEMEQ